MGKKKSKDFQKVKLKVGKKLKKGENVTNASFRSRSIQVTQQLKLRDGSEPSTRKKQNIKELLSQCRHYNISVRHEAVTGIRELMTSHPEMMTSHLSSVIETTAELLMDKDSNVRKAVIRLFNMILPSLSERQVTPFFPLMCAHLCCAMTHIYSDIQVDSMVILDLLLETFPTLLIRQSDQVLSNFIEQISRQQGQNKNSRSLSVNPSSKTSSQKWRTSVLNRLSKFLRAIQATQTCDAMKQTDSLNVLWTEKQHSCSDLYPSHFSGQWEEPGFTLSTFAGGKVTESSSGSQSTVSGLAQFVLTFIPVLLECWVEACPAHNNGGGLLQTENLGLVSGTLSVSQMLMECVSQMKPDDKACLPIDRYHENFQQHFLSHFPYSVHTPVPSESRDKGETAEGQSISGEYINLTICDIMTHFLLDLTNQNADSDISWLPLVTHYLQEFLEGTYCSKTGQYARTTVRILQRLMVVNHSQAGLQTLLRILLRKYKAAASRSSEKRVYLQFLADSVLQSHHKDVLSEVLQQEFLSSLPELLAPAVEDSPQMTSLLLRVMKQGTCQRCACLLSAIQKQLPLWFDPDCGVVKRVDRMRQKDLIELLYSVEDLSDSMLRRLVTFCSDPSTDVQQITYLLTVLQNRTDVGIGRQSESEMLYLRFLLTLILGVTSEELQSFQQSHDQSCDIAVPSGCEPGGYTIISNMDYKELERHLYNTEAVITLLKLFSNQNTVMSAIFNFLDRVLKQHSILPVSVALAVSQVFPLLYSPQSEVDVTSILNACISLVHKSVLEEESANEMEGNIWTNIRAACCHVIEAVPNGITTCLSQLIQFTTAEPEIQQAIVKIVSLFLVEDNRCHFKNGSDISRLLLSMVERFKNSLRSSNHPSWFTEFQYSVTVFTN